MTDDCSLLSAYQELIVGTSPICSVIFSLLLAEFNMGSLASLRRVSTQRLAWPFFHQSMSGSNSQPNRRGIVVDVSIFFSFDFFINKLISRFCALPTYILLQKRLPLDSCSLVSSFYCVSAALTAPSSALISVLKIYNDIVA